MKLSQYSNSLLIDLDLKAKNKEDVLNKLVELLKKSGKVSDEEKVRNDLTQREEIASTGLTYGIAIPHCRTTGVNGLVIGFARSQKGVDFDALDGGKSHLFFLIVAPVNLSSRVLGIVGYISDKLRSKEEREKLYQAQFPQEILNFLDDA